MTTITFPANYSYVLASAVSTGFLGLYQSTLVSKARKASGIKYPNTYATNEQALKDPHAMQFNCRQRAHANTLESLPFFLFSLLFSGLQYPTAAAALGAAWVSGRVLYTAGYATGSPANRMYGVFHNIGFLGLLITSSLSVYNMIIAGQ